MAKPARRLAELPPPSAPAKPAPATPAKAPAAGTGKFTTFDPHIELDEALPDGVTVLDFLLATDREDALRLKALRVNGKPRAFDAVPIPGDDLEYYLAARPTVTLDWLGFVKTGAARQTILRATGLLSDQTARYASSGTKGEHGAMAKKDKTGGGIKGAQGEITARTSAQQANREGKKLIGAYIDKQDVVRLKAMLTEQGLTVQDFFADAVARALTATPAQRARMVSRQVARFRKLLDASLK